MPNTCVNYEKKCGGCPLLALPYREQLAKKQARLQELLGGFAPVKAVQGMAEPLHYRNKAIASFATQRGKLVCGLYAEGTHRVLPGADCLLQEEILNKTLAAVLDAARACRWTAYDEDRGTGLLRHTVLRSSCSGKVLVTLVTPGPDLPGSKNFCTALRKKAPWVVSIVQNINPTRSSAVLGSPDYTTERMLTVLRLLRGEYRFGGYIHAKAIPGTSPELVHTTYRGSQASIPER